MQTLLKTRDAQGHTPFSLSLSLSPPSPPPSPSLCSQSERYGIYHLMEKLMRILEYSQKKGFKPSLSHSPISSLSSLPFLPYPCSPSLERKFLLSFLSSLSPFPNYLKMMKGQIEVASVVLRPSLDSLRYLLCTRVLSLSCTFTDFGSIFSVSLPLSHVLLFSFYPVLSLSRRFSLEESERERRVS